MTISFVIPSMRPIMVRRVLHDLNNQTLLPTRVILVDNSTQYFSNTKYLYDLVVERPSKNLGTNPVWNIALRLEDTYCGILGDDYRLEPTMVEKMVYGLNIKYDGVEAGAVVPEIIQQEKRRPIKTKNIRLEHLRGLLLGTGKGKCSAVLMKREVANAVPLIPDHYNIFFGDNWIGHHIIHKLGLAFVQLYPCFIYHIPGVNNVSASLNYKGVLKHERGFWNKFVREEANK